MKKPSVEQQIVEGLESLAKSLESGEDLPRRFTCRTLRLEIQTGKYSPAMVKRTRAALCLSQSLFARFLGISPSTVRAWEQGTKSPQPIACRFMDEIRREPERWRSRVGQLMQRKTVR
jgi:putative transcriptional regulator